MNNRLRRPELEVHSVLFSLTFCSSLLQGNDRAGAIESQVRRNLTQQINGHLEHRQTNRQRSSLNQTSTTTRLEQHTRSLVADAAMDMKFHYRQRPPQTPGALNTLLIGAPGYALHSSTIAL
jgi:hypothetical protein